MASRGRPQGFVQWEVVAPEGAVADRVVAEAHAAGAAGLEELAEPGHLRVFATADRADAVTEALLRMQGDGVRVAAGPSPVVERDWSEAWKEGLDAVQVEGRLCVRPPFARRPEGFAGPCVVIEPGQAFGTGAHASTYLALELLVRWMAGGSVALDVGCGSGVLALAALSLGARRAVAFDLDPLAAPAALDNARANDLPRQLRAFTGPLSALRPELRFDLVVANMIRTELEPLFAPMVDRLAGGGVLVVSGLLAAELDSVRDHLSARGLDPIEALTRSDATGDDWAGLALRARV